MDDAQFDRFVQVFGRGLSRRGALGVLGALAAAGVGEVTAKRKPRKDRKKDRRRVQAGDREQGTGQDALPAGNENDGVAICHHEGNEAFHKITVARPAVRAHLDNHGDFLFGECCADEECARAQRCHHDPDHPNAESACVCDASSCLEAGGCCKGNACEPTDLENDPANCGRCGKACDAPDHATATCANGQCGFSCDAGWIECNGACVAACFVGTWGTRGSGDGQFQTPRGGGIAPDGTVYVADLNNHRVQYFTPDGGFLGKWGRNGGDGSPGNGDGQFNNPNDVAVAPDGTVYVADFRNQRIQRFTPTGGFLGKWGTPGSGDGQFNEPRFVAVAADGTVYVSDNLNDRVQYFTPSGGFLGRWGGTGGGDGQFRQPRGIAVAPDGTVYVVDLGNHRIQRFTATGEFLGAWGRQGSGQGEFQEPRFVAVAPDGTVYVSDAIVNRIKHFEATGAVIGEWGTAGSGDGEFQSPHGVEVSAAGTIYVVDSANHRVQYFLLP